MRRKNTLKRKTAQIASLVLVSGILFSGCAKEAETTSKAIEVSTTPVSIGNVEVDGNFVGVVEANETVSVFPKLSGQVTTKNFEVGDQVKAGDVLFTLDKQALVVARKSAQAEVKSAQANYDAQKFATQATNTAAIESVGTITTKEQELALQTNNAIRDVENATQNRDLAQKQINGYRDIANISRKAKSSAHEDVEKHNAESSVQSAIMSENEAIANKNIGENTMFSAQESQHLAEKNQLDYEMYSKNSTYANANAQIASGAAQETSAEAQLLTAHANLEAANLQLSYTTITAPISGTIQQINVKKYGMASDQQAAYVITGQGAKKVSFYVTDKVVHQLQQGQKVTMEKGGATYEAAVSAIGTTQDPLKGLYKVEAILSGDGFDALPPGANVKLKTAVEQAQSVLTIPIGAVYYSNEKPYVFVAENNKAVKKEITTGVANSDSIQVLSGLAVNDPVITSWTAQLRDQSDITIKGSEESKESKTEDTAADQPAENANNAPEENPESAPTESTEIKSEETKENKAAEQPKTETKETEAK